MSQTLEKIGGAVTARREQLGMTKRAAHRRAGVSDTTWSKIEDAERVSLKTLRLAAAALEWPSDALIEIGEGADPGAFPHVNWVEPPTSSGVPTGSDLRSLLAVGGQVVEDRLTAIEDRLDRLEERVATDTERGGTVTPIRPDGTQVPTGWVYAAERDDGQPTSDDPSKTPSTPHRPTRATFDPDDPGE